MISLILIVSQGQTPEFVGKGARNALLPHGFSVAQGGGSTLTRATKNSPRLTVESEKRKTSYPLSIGFAWELSKDTAQYCLFVPSFWETLSSQFLFFEKEAKSSVA